MLTLTQSPHYHDYHHLNASFRTDLRESQLHLYYFYHGHHLVIDLRYWWVFGPLKSANKWLRYREVFQKKWFKINSYNFFVEWYPFPPDKDIVLDSFMSNLWNLMKVPPPESNFCKQCQAENEQVFIHDSSPEQQPPHRNFNIQHRSPSNLNI